MSVLRGAYVAVVTPFVNGRDRLCRGINYGALDKLLSHLVQGGVNGVVVAGCTGSASVLSHEEQVGLVKYVNEHFGKSLQVIAGDGSNCTWEAVDLAKAMENDAGVDLHLSISPYYNKPSDAGIIAHYENIVERISGKLILYSVPSRTGGRGILPNVVETLSKHPRIIGLKDSSGDISRIREIISKTNRNTFSVLSGDDSLALDVIGVGGVGLVSVAGNVSPCSVSRMISLALAGRRDDALSINEELRPLYSALFPKSEANPSPNPSTCHYVLNRLGFDVGSPRLPLMECSLDEKNVIDSVLEKLFEIRRVAYHS